MLINNDVTAANGGDWLLKTSGTTNNLYGVAFTGSNAIAVGDSAAIYSSNWGNTWTTSTSRKVDGYQYRAVSFAGGTSLAWAVGLRGRTITSTNAGVNWTLSYADNIADLTSVSATSASSGIIAGMQGTLSRYNGTAWVVHSVPSGDRITMTVSAFGTQSRNVTLRFDSPIYDSRYSVKAVSIGRSQVLKTCYKSGWETGKYAATFDNEDVNNDTIIFKANITMTKVLFNYTEIDKAYLTITNQTSRQVVWQGYMGKDSTAGSRTWMFKSTVSIASWSDGYYKAVVDAYEVDGSSDRLLGETTAKTTFFFIT